MAVYILENYRTVEAFEKLTKDNKRYKYHVNDIPAFQNMGYIAPYAAENEIFFERTFEGRDAIVMDWFAKHWHYSIYLSIVYIICIYAGRWFMHSRPKYDLRNTLIVWNLILAVFSIVGAARCIGEIFNYTTIYGFYYSVCHPNCFYGVPGFWALLFVLSKAYELGDTAFIVLRKQPLIFLHWYHHVTVLIYSWYSYSEHAAPGRWFCIMNYNVHAIMYTYYAARAARCWIPNALQMLLTTLQVSQMFVGSGVCLYAYYLKSTGQFCHTSIGNMQWALLMYFTYLLLFVNYFYQTYFRKAVSRLTTGGVKFPMHAANGTNGHTINGYKSHEALDSKKRF